MWIDVFFQRRHTVANRPINHYSKPPWVIIKHQTSNTKVTIVKKRKNNKCWWGYRGKGILVYWWCECKLLQPLWKSMEFPQKLKIKLVYGPAIPLLGISLKKMKTLIQKNTCTSMFIAALFTTAKTWKQCKCLSTDKWYTHTHSGILFYHKKEDLAICNNKGGPWEHYAEWNKLDRDK